MPILPLTPLAKVLSHNSIVALATWKQFSKKAEAKCIEIVQ